MAKDLHLLDEAAEEAHAAWEWYAARSGTAANRFKEELTHAMERIRDSLGQFPLMSTGRATVNFDASLSASLSRVRSGH